MSANFCVESHMRELLEQGFARHPDLGDGYQAALVNSGYLTNAVYRRMRP